MVRVCLQCGDKGYSNAFNYCVKCQNYVVHRYCLDRLPKTLDESVYWVCDNCEVDLSKDVDGQSPVVQEETRRLRWKEKSALSLGQEADGRLESSHSSQPEDTELAINSPLSTEFKEKEGSCSAAKVEDRKPGDPNKKLELIGQRNRDHELSSLEKFKKKTMEIKSSSANLSEQGAKECLVASQLASGYLEDNSSVHNREPAEPLIEPIWRGEFIILNKDYEGFDNGLVAHLSSKACQKVYEEAMSLPLSLELKMLAKLDCWPKSFRKSKPSGGDIALYFFPLDKRSEGLFDYLVEEMIDQGFALTAIVKNGELLIFTSNELPLSQWRFHGKYYLWGVFRGRQVSAFQAAEYQGSITEEATKLVKAKRYEKSS